ncbi:uncharacterized protein LOC129743652 isoform X2 [Uranotaenia lowii]|uniref:uncharacterized protein LOC129743652 isoform X2 n=1 Tax=Uranotaenia lowii TaxID=190385 RepID=UPI00247A6CF6|nr:uncharacterized protein LOC129743652 isoform X2 [Uranotaenia lowii]
MVFSSYNNASYLPLDSDQSVTFYKNENQLFPPPPPSSSVGLIGTPGALACRRNSPVMLTGSNDRMLGNDFQSVAHLSSNGYYGYIPPQQPMAATEVVGNKLETETSGYNGGTNNINNNNNDGFSIGAAGGNFLLDCHPQPASLEDSPMMEDSDGLMENYPHQQQQQHQPQFRKRKENGLGDLEQEEMPCGKRQRMCNVDREPQDHQQQFLSGASGFNGNVSWNPIGTQQMDYSDQPMNNASSMNFSASALAGNGFGTGSSTMISNGHFQSSMPAPSIPQSASVLQPRSKYTETSRCMMSHMI